MHLGVPLFYQPLASSFNLATLNNIIREDDAPAQQQAVVNGQYELEV